MSEAEAMGVYYPGTVDLQMARNERSAAVSKVRSIIECAKECAAHDDCNYTCAGMTDADACFSVRVDRINLCTVATELALMEAVVEAAHGPQGTVVCGMGPSVRDLTTYRKEHSL